MRAVGRMDQVDGRESGSATRFTNPRGRIARWGEATGRRDWGICGRAAEAESLWERGGIDGVEPVVGGEDHLPRKWGKGDWGFGDSFTEK